MKTWVKLYTEIIEDPDQGTLSLAERGIWSLFLALCGRIDDRDEYGRETGKLDTLARVAWYLRCDATEIKSAVDSFAMRGMVEEHDGVLYLPNFAARQQRKASDTPANISERVRRHREMKRACNADVTPLQHPVTRTDTDTDTESDTESDTETDAETDADIAAAAVQPASDDDYLTRGVRYYEGAIGLVAGMRQSEEIRMSLEELHERGLDDWWQTAIDIAVDANARNWRYISAILTNHLREGVAPTRKTGPIHGPPKPQKRTIRVIDPQTGQPQVVEAMV